MLDGVWVLVLGCFPGFGFRRLGSLLRCDLLIGFCRWCGGLCDVG